MEHTAATQHRRNAGSVSNWGSNLGCMWEVPEISADYEARAASCNGCVHLFVCLFLCLSPNCENAIFSKTKQFRAIVSIDDL